MKGNGRHSGNGARPAGRPVAAPRRLWPPPSAGAPAPAPDGPAKAGTVLGLEMYPGEVRAKVAAGRGGGVHRVTLRPRSHRGALRRTACELVVFNRDWINAMSTGFPVRADLFASAVARKAPKGVLVWRDVPGECDCGDGSGSCRHAKAALSQVRRIASESDLLRLRLHGFDPEEWLADPASRESGAEERWLGHCWQEGENKWVPKPLGRDIPLPGKDVRTAIEEELRISPYWEELASFMMSGVAVTAQGTEGVGEGLSRGAGQLREVGPLSVTIREDCSIRSLLHGREDTPWGRECQPGEWEPVLVMLLAQLRPEDAEGLGEPNIYWHRLFLHTMELVRAGAVIPEVTGGGPGVGRRVIWRPATMRSGAVLEAHQQFVDACPPHLIRMVRDGSGGAALRASAEMQVRHATDILFRGMLEVNVRHHGEDLKRKMREQTVVGAALFGWGPNFDLELENGLDWDRFFAWLRRLSAPAVRPRASMLLGPSRRDPEVIEMDLSFRDVDGGVSPIGFILENHATPWLVCNYSDLGDFLGGDLMSDPESTGASYDLPLRALNEFLEETLDDLNALDVSVAISSLLYEPRELWLGRTISLREEAKGEEPGLASRLVLRPAAMVGEREIDFGEAYELIEREYAAYNALPSKDRPSSLDVHAHHQGDYFIVGDEARTQHAILKYSDPLRAGQSGSEPDPFALLEAAFTGKHGANEVRVDKEAREFLERMLEPGEPPKPPQGLAAELLPHQHEGFGWLAHNADIGLGSVLADEKGLGKKEQVAALILHRTRRDSSHKSLVIAPREKTDEWLDALRRLAPGLRAKRHTGSGRIPDLDAHDVTVCDYGATRSGGEGIRERTWGLMVLDDVPPDKGPKSALISVLGECKAQASIALTDIPAGKDEPAHGTMFRLTNPGLFGWPGKFRGRLKGIEAELKEKGQSRVLELVQALYLRRVMKNGKVARIPLEDGL